MRSSDWSSDVCSSDLITGLIVQPIVGHLSDGSRSRFGRRRPFLIAGGLLTALALLIMPSATTLWASVAALWLLTASNNISMDPARALVADNLPRSEEHTSELQSLMRISYAVFCLKKKNTNSIAISSCHTLTNPSENS